MKMTVIVIVNKNAHSQTNSSYYLERSIFYQENTRHLNHILNIRDANMFHNRVINFWNKLPDSVVLAASISNFKRQLLSFVLNVGFEHFSVN